MLYFIFHFGWKGIKGGGGVEDFIILRFLNNSNKLSFVMYTLHGIYFTKVYTFCIFNVKNNLDRRKYCIRYVRV